MKIKRFPNYEIFKDGTIYSHNIKNNLKQYVSKTGYYCVSLRNKGKRKDYKVHRLLAISFIPNPNNYPILNHKDGNPLNNNLDNLEWCDYSHNIKHAYKYKLRNKLLGEKANRAVLRDSQIAVIRRLYSQGNKIRQLALNYGVNYETMRCVVLNKTWKHIK